MNLTEPQAGSDLGALRSRAERARRRHLPHHRPEDLHHLWRARPDATTSSISCWRACPTRRPARAASRCSSCRSSWSTPTARSARATTLRCSGARAQARHPRLADLHHGLRRQGRRHRLADRRGEPRPRLHVHDDEQRPPQRRPAGRRHRRARATSRRSPTRASAARAGRPAATGEGMSPIIEHPDVRRMLLTMRAQTQAARGHLLPARRGASTAPIASRTRPSARPRPSAPRC